MNEKVFVIRKREPYSDAWENIGVITDQDELTQFMARKAQETAALPPLYRVDYTYDCVNVIGGEENK